ncbi:helix-turn-helix domain-containing protein [Kushneria aurantia]|uniref:Helix-turn-helix domain-containing protein n=1 Tax=Kushneria aurantia TaxID=504092 RepID=A0ABV6G4G3_9GAMM|nr:helix-turn-helix transcriptional regulator [Kushneria aurantia]
MNLKVLRKRAAMTQRELGEATNLGQTAIANYETGYRTPDLDKVRAIVSALRRRGVEVTLDDVVGEPTAAA